MKVSEIMSKNLVTVSPDCDVRMAAELMRRHGIGSVPVASDLCVEGIVTDRDIVTRCVAQGNSVSETKLCDIMSKDIASVSPSDSLQDALQIMSEVQVQRLPVVENGKLSGILTISDIVKLNRSAEISEAIADIKR